jgi:hypothetical protein
MLQCQEQQILYMFTHLKKYKNYARKLQIQGRR